MPVHIISQNGLLPLASMFLNDSFLFCSSITLGVLTANNVTNSSNANVTNGSNSNSNSTLVVTPKIEQSPPNEHYERQTVLMWGTSSHSNSSNRSPTTTPTSNGLYSSESTHMKLSNQMVMSPSEQHQQHSHHNSTPSSGGHMKWSEGGAGGAGSGNGTSTAAGSASAKEIPVSAGVYQIHAHQSETASAAVDASSMYAHVAHSPHLSHHSSSSSAAAAAAASAIVSPEHHSSATPSQSHPHVSQQTIGSSCEVWSPAYSQYQYFTYHPAPQHANTQ